QVRGCFGPSHTHPARRICTKYVPRPTVSRCSRGLNGAEKHHPVEALSCIGTRMNQRSQATPFIPRELWTAPQLADYLGKPIKYVYRLTHERRIDHYVIGKELRFDPEHVAAFL